MFREMRRIKQILSQEDSLAILRRSTSGVLAVAGDDDYPYAVPLNYIYDDENKKIYFHCAKIGHKMDAMTRNPKVSFCVIDQDEIIPEKCTSYFRSVIVFGKVEILQEKAIKRKALEKLAKKYSPGHEEVCEYEVNQKLNVVCMLELSIDHMSGKEAIELVRDIHL